jgi:outer membrane protein OmpA-like peptidoglycan-associated protein
MKLLRTALVLSLVMCTLLSQAQIGSYFDKFRPAKKWSLGLQLSPTHTMSDADNIQLGFAYGLHVKYSVSQSFGLKIQGNLGTLKGNREDHDISGNKADGRNSTSGADNRADGKNTFNAGNQAPSDDSYFFKNNFKEVSVTTVFTLGNISFLRPLRNWQLFLFTGFGTIWSDVQGEFGDPQDARNYYATFGDNYFNVVRDGQGTIQNAKTTYEGRNFTVPFGFGVKRNLGRVLDLGLEYRMNYTRSDNLDAFSFPVWRNRYADFYGLLGIQASFKLGGKDNIKDHYDWLNPVESIYKTMDSLEKIGEKVELLLVDSDGDGVADYYDTEPETEEGAWAWGNGVAADIDGDKVPDFRDDQPFSEKGSIVDANGVMVDKDRDGVPDYRDDDTNTPAAYFVKPDGTHEVRTSGGGAGCCNCDDVILPSIIFDPGSSIIKPEFYGVLYSVAEKMKECPNLEIIATGYSVRSKAQSNLSVTRTNAIIKHLNQTYSVPRDRFGVDTNGFAPGDLEYSSRRIDLFKRP